MLDLPAAFDTFWHSKLLILKSSFSIDRNVLSWIKSYLENRCFKVKTGTAFSEVKESNIGVPQCSVLGPMLFNCVMAGLPRILESLGAKCHLHADNTQFVVTFDMGDEMSARSKIVEIFAAIKAFMFENCLKLNASKTVFIPFSRHQTKFHFNLNQRCQFLLPMLQEI